jgi:large subunit ribosomal protein L18
MLKKEIRRKGIQKRVRKVVSGTKERPRLSVFRSNKQIYAQLIDDNSGTTLAFANSCESEIASKIASKVELAKLVGIAVANKAKQAGITSIVFDRGGYLYHGRIKSLAEGAREGGLKF